MLSIGAMSGGKGNYYLNLAREDYYLAGGEPPGRWTGSGAKDLGLEGQVRGDDLRSLLQGLTPAGKALVQNAGDKRRQNGWDLTFSAPKSVSVLWSQADENVREKIQKAHAAAVESALDLAEQLAGESRRGKGGLEREKAKLIFATFEHGTSRELDPQLHTHALLFNAGIRKDGTTGAVVSKGIYQLKMALGALYRLQLAQALNWEMGCEIIPTKNGFEVGGVSEAVMEKFSTRRAQIEKELKNLGLNGAEAAKVAALNTRQKKSQVPRKELFERWQAMAKGFGWSTENPEKTLGRNLPREAKGIHQIFAEAIDGRIQGQSFFTAAEILRDASNAAVAHGIAAATVSGAWNELIERKMLVSLGTWKEQQRYTTHEVIAEEKALLALVNESAGETRFQLNPIRVMNVLDERFSMLNQEQRNAVHHITGLPGGIAAIAGLAGTGKSTLLKASRELWEAAGFRVTGTALSAKAARGLEQSSGIKSVTIAKALLELEKPASTVRTVKKILFPKAPKWSPFHGLRVSRLEFDFRRQQFLDSKTILVVDEAGMVDTKKMAALLRAAKSAGAKVVLAGDERQLQPINAGAPFRAVGKILGRAEVSEIVRQELPVDREAVRDFATGDPKQAIAALEARNLVRYSKDEKASTQEMFLEWGRGGIKYPERTLILTDTRDAADAINLEAQTKRHAAGVLGKSKAKTPDGLSVYEKDRVLFTKNNRFFGVDNGTFGTIQKIKNRLVSFQLDDGRNVIIPEKKLEHLSLGYASTTHKAQGATVPRALVMVGEKMQDRELTYVQASRAAKETKFFSTDRAGFKRQAARSNAKFLAHELIFPEKKREMDIPL
jgi:conjugative relaxase-like TrwC/TraI family protein